MRNETPLPLDEDKFACLDLTIPKKFMFVSEENWKLVTEIFANVVRNTADLVGCFLLSLRYGSEYLIDEGLSKIHRATATQRFAETLNCCQKMAPRVPLVLDIGYFKDKKVIQEILEKAGVQPLLARKSGSDQKLSPGEIKYFSCRENRNGTSVDLKKVRAKIGEETMLLANVKNLPVEEIERIIALGLNSKRKGVAVILNTTDPVFHLGFEEVKRGVKEVQKLIEFSQAEAKEEAELEIPICDADWRELELELLWTNG